MPPANPDVFDTKTKIPTQHGDRAKSPKPRLSSSISTLSNADASSPCTRLALQSDVVLVQIAAERHDGQKGQGSRCSNEDIRELLSADVRQRKRRQGRLGRLGASKGLEDDGVLAKKSSNDIMIINLL